VHRDVKPANILLEEDVDRVRITDFGLARAADDASVTRTGILAGTPQYMSPDQTRGEPIDPRSDLFSLGSVMYAMCTGRPPFRAETTMGVLRRISDDAPRPPREVNSDIPEWLETIILRLLAKAPGDRYASAAKVADLLEQCLAHLQHPTSTPLTVITGALTLPAGGVLQKRRNVLRAAAVLLLIAVGLSVGPFWSAVHKPSTDPRSSSGAPVESSSPASDVPESLRWHDGTYQQLYELEQDTLRIEAETRLDLNDGA
jgi:serine/threonine protein kinase